MRNFVLRGFGNLEEVFFKFVYGYEEDCIKEGILSQVIKGEQRLIREMKEGKGQVDMSVVCLQKVNGLRYLENRFMELEGWSEQLIKIKW